MSTRIRHALAAVALLAALVTSMAACSNYGNSGGNYSGGGGGMGTYPTPMPTTRPTM